MRDYDATTSSWLEGRRDVLPRYLLWISARNRDTGETETMGLWTGLDSQVIEVEGEERTYYGAGALLDIGRMSAGVGIEVRMLTVRLSALTPEVAQLMRGYDARLAPVQIHRALMDDATRQPIAPPFRIWSGWVDEADITTGPQPEATMRVASDALRLTRGVPLYRSDAAQQQVHAGDRFREYTDIGGRIPIFWNREGKEKVPGGKKGIPLPPGLGPRR